VALKKEVDHAREAQGTGSQPSISRQDGLQPERIVTVLAISPSAEDHNFLRDIFGHSKWQIRGVRTWREAHAFLADHQMPVIICESELPDANWKIVLSEVSHLADPPALIVVSRLADDYLWAEVLNLGGYDVLMKPFDETEVFRVVGLAWLNWKNCRERAKAASAYMMPAAS
jgi:DNA-binding response OmpR family regulator